jgi:hypothetical protein
MRRTIALIILALFSLASVVRAQTATPITLGAARQDSIAPTGTNYYSVSSVLAAPSQVLLTALAGFPTRMSMECRFFPFVNFSSIVNYSMFSVIFLV